MKRLPVLAFCVSLVLPLCADSGILVPREVFVGDTAELSFTTNALSEKLDSGSVLIVSPSDYPVSPALTIAHIEIREGDSSATVFVRFIPWKSGVVQIPPFSVKKISLAPPPVRISSLVEKTGRKTLERPRSPLLVPGTTYYLYGGILSALAFGTVCLFAGIRLKRLFSASKGRKNTGMRVRTAMKQLKQLERQIQKTQKDAWYARYAGIVRRYLGSFCADDADAFKSSTAGEIVETLRFRLTRSEGTGSGLQGAPLHEKVQALLNRIDTTRFSGYAVLDPFSGDIQLARSLIDALEEACSQAPGEADFKDTVETDGEGSAHVQL
jgi:hypothetical protein